MARHSAIPSTEAVPVLDEATCAEPVRERYVRSLLELYVTTPGVLGRVRQADRALARQLYDQRIPLCVVANAFIVAAARRARHNAFSTPLPPIRALHYFLGTIRELLDRPLGPRDIEELRRALGLPDLRR
jgi:hypothetical protein